MPEQGKAPPPTPKLTTVDIVLVGSLVVLADTVELLLLFFGLDDFFISDAIAFPATQIYLRYKGAKGTYSLIANCLEVIPYVGDLPLRTIGFGFTVYFDRHPKVAAVVTKAAQVKGGNLAAGKNRAGRRVSAPNAGGVGFQGGPINAGQVAAGPAVPGAGSLTIPSAPAQQPSFSNIAPSEGGGSFNATTGAAVAPLVPDYNPIQELQQQIEREQAPDFLAADIAQRRRITDVSKKEAEERFLEKEEEQRQKRGGENVYQALREVGASKDLPAGDNLALEAAEEKEQTQPTEEELLERARQREAKLAQPQAALRQVAQPPASPQVSQEKPEEPQEQVVAETTPQPEPDIKAPPVEPAIPGQSQQPASPPTTGKEEAVPTPAPTQETVKLPGEEDLFGVAEPVVKTEAEPEEEKAKTKKPPLAEPQQAVVPAEEVEPHPSPKEELQKLYESQREEREEKKAEQAEKEAVAQAAPAKPEGIIGKLEEDLLNTQYGPDEGKADNVTPFPQPKQKEEDDGYGADGNNIDLRKAA